MTISSITASSVTLNLSDLGGADQCVIYIRARGNSLYWTVDSVKTGTGSFVVSGLSGGIAYEVMAVPQDVSGVVGESSDVIQFALQSPLTAWTPGDPATRFNLRDALLFLKDKLENIVWPGSVNKVFNEVVIGTHFYREQASLINAPMAILSIGDESLSEHGGEEEPIFRQSQIVIGVIARVGTDPYGLGVLMGNRPANDTTSPAGGLLEIQPVLYDAMRKGDQSDDFRYTYVNRSRPRPITIDSPETQIMEYLYRVEIAESNLGGPSEGF